MKEAKQTVEKITIDLRQYGIRDRLAQTQLAVTVQGRHEVKSAGVTPSGNLEVIVNVGALKGNDKAKAKNKLASSIVSTVQHKAQVLNKQLATTTAT